MADGSELAAQAKSKVLQTVGGPARLQVIAVLAAVLALDMADMGTVSAVSDRLKRAFGIGDTELGLLLAVVSFTAAIGVIPAGVLADRIRRRRILIVAIGLWSVAMVLGGAAWSYGWFLGTRILLGGIAAAAWPCVASLTGDFFPPTDRARVYGMIIGGEGVGLGIGVVVSGGIASFLSWRSAFFIMAVLGAGVAAAVWKLLPEPERGGQSWLQAGETDPQAASGRDGSKDEDRRPRGEQALARQIVKERNVQPRQELILTQDPTRRSWLWAIGYCLRIPSYRLLIIGSALAYYFFSGVRAFAMIYVTGHYHVSHGVAVLMTAVIGVGALAGVVAGGRISTRLLERGRLSARIIVPAVALIVSTPFLGLGIWTGSLWLGMTLFTLGAGVLAAALPPIDAARLDIVHPRLWGRAEAGRMALRATFEGSAPLLFGAISGWLGGGPRGLMWTFLMMLAPMIAACVCVAPGLRTYPRDVATAAASVEAVRKGSVGAS